MRKIEQKACQAFWVGKLFKQDNTSVQREFLPEGEFFTMRSFNNTIAKRNVKTGEVFVTLAGWNSVTTKSRLNALRAGISTKQFKPYINGELMDVYAWYKLPFTVKESASND